MITVYKASKKYQIPESALRTLIAARALAVVFVGRRIYILEKSLLEFLNNSEGRKVQYFETRSVEDLLPRA
jgi:hypothetical protein